MKNFFLWRLLLRRTAPRADLALRRAKVARHRQEAFGPITPETRAEDRQRLADAAAGKADRLI